MGGWFSSFWGPALAASQSDKPMENSAGGTTVNALNGAIVNSPQLSASDSGRDNVLTPVNNRFACDGSSSEQCVRPVAFCDRKGMGKACNVTCDRLVAPCTSYNIHDATFAHHTPTFACNDPQHPNEGSHLVCPLRKPRLDLSDVRIMPEDLLKTLQDLRDEEFGDFKWYLQQPDSLEGYCTIKVFKLEKAKRRDTVDLMVQTYGFDGALKVTKKVLEKIDRNDLVQSLSDTSSGPEACYRSTSVQYVDEVAPSTVTKFKQRGKAPNEKPLVTPRTRYNIHANTSAKQNSQHLGSRCQAKLCLDNHRLDEHFNRDALASRICENVWAMDRFQLQTLDSILGLLEPTFSSRPLKNPSQVQECGCDITNNSSPLSCPTGEIKSTDSAVPPLLPTLSDSLLPTIQHLVNKMNTIDIRLQTLEAHTSGLQPSSSRAFAPNFSAPVLEAKPSSHTKLANSLACSTAAHVLERRYASISDNATICPLEIRPAATPAMRNPTFTRGDRQHELRSAHCSVDPRQKCPASHFQQRVNNPSATPKSV